MNLGDPSPERGCQLIYVFLCVCHYGADDCQVLKIRVTDVKHYVQMWYRIWNSQSVRAEAESCCYVRDC